MYECLIKLFLPETRMDDGAELQLILYFPNIPGLSPKSYRREYDMKKCVLLIVGCRVKLVGPLVLFENIRIMPPL